MTDTGIFFTSLATVRYNNVNITDITKSRVKSTPVYNAQETAVKYVEHTIEIEAIVTPDSYENEHELEPEDSTDIPLEWLRKRLLEPRGDLDYYDKGFGRDFSISYSQNRFEKQSVDYGPKPTVLMFETMGCNKAARIAWTCTVRIPECSNAYFKGLCEFWVTSSLNIKKNGYQKLTRTGKIEIMEGGDKINTHLSNTFRPYVLSLLSTNTMPAYHLEQDYKFSPDDRVCDFTQTYTEIESTNPYPTGVVEIDATHEMSSKLMPGNPFEAGYKTWTNTMDCNITLRPGVPKTKAWAIFSTLAAERVGQSIEPIFKTKNKKIVERVRVPYILSLNIQEDIFADSTSFTVVWVSAANDIRTILTKSGMFKPVQSTNWLDWEQDMRLNAQNPYGRYLITDLGNTTAIIDPCNQSGPASYPKTRRTGDNPYVIPIFNPKPPPKESSWADYQTKVEIKAKAATKSHRRYKDVDEIETRSTSPNSTSDKTQFYIPRTFHRNLKSDDYHHQDFGNDKFTATLRGYAIRIGYPTTPPEIVSVGNQPVRISDEETMISDQQLTSGYQDSIHLTMWNIVYEILGSPYTDLDKDRNTTGEAADHQI
jgi:hypothetical protein